MLMFPFPSTSPKLGLWHGQTISLLLASVWMTTELPPYVTTAAATVAAATNSIPSLPSSLPPALLCVVLDLRPGLYLLLFLCSRSSLPHHSFSLLIASFLFLSWHLLPWFSITCLLALLPKCALSGWALSWPLEDGFPQGAVGSPNSHFLSTGKHSPIFFFKLCFLNPKGSY